MIVLWVATVTCAFSVLWVVNKVKMADSKGECVFLECNPFASWNSLEYRRHIGDEDLEKVIF